MEVFWELSPLPAFVPQPASSHEWGAALSSTGCDTDVEQNCTGNPREALECTVSVGSPSPPDHVA